MANMLLGVTPRWPRVSPNIWFHSFWRLRTAPGSEAERTDPALHDERADGDREHLSSSASNGSSSAVGLATTSGAARATRSASCKTSEVSNSADSMSAEASRVPAANGVTGSISGCGCECDEVARPSGRSLPVAPRVRLPRERPRVWRLPAGATAGGIIIGSRDDTRRARAVAASRCLSACCSSWRSP